jgi:hypothetical protein
MNNRKKQSSLKKKKSVEKTPPKRPRLQVNLIDSDLIATPCEEEMPISRER